MKLLKEYFSSRRIFNWLGSSLWASASAIVRLASQQEVVKPVRLNSRVLSVGNIQAGGAGKTPLVAQIVREATEKGYKVCILSRGYKGLWERTGGVIAPKDQNVDQKVDPALCGDEPALLHELCPSAYIGVGAHRVRQYEAVLRQSGTSMDLVILDDGFQNWKIQKDLEIVALTSKKFGEVMFRDWKSSLKNAHLLVWTKGEQSPYHGPLPLARVRYQLPPALSKQSLWFVTGIADGEAAYRLALEAGYSLVRHIPFQDHFIYSAPAIQEILSEASKNQCKVALTGKDWVKWKSLGVSKSEVIVLEPEILFENGLNLWSHALWGR